MTLQIKYNMMNNSHCTKENHDFQKIKYLCIDTNCKQSEKLGCADCFLQDHSEHHRVHTEEFINQSNQRFTDMKMTQCDGIDQSVTDLNDRIEQEFSNCAGAILQRFENVKLAIKQSVEQEAALIQLHQDELNNEIESQARRFSNIVENPLYELNEEQLNHLTNLYHSFPALQLKHEAQIQQMKQDRDLIAVKKSKQLRKLQLVVDNLLREFNESVVQDQDECKTPEKKTTVPSSNTKSPPNIMDLVRRRAPYQSKKVR